VVEIGGGWQRLTSKPISVMTAVALPAALLVLLVVAGGSQASSIHTVVTTECSPYFSWQSLGEALQGAPTASFLAVWDAEYAAGASEGRRKGGEGAVLAAPTAAATAGGHFLPSCPVLPCRHVFQPPPVWPAGAHHPHHVLHPGGV
jgi:hypothetical protein